MHPGTLENGGCLPVFILRPRLLQSPRIAASGQTLGASLPLVLHPAIPCQGGPEVQRYVPAPLGVTRSLPSNSDGLRRPLGTPARSTFLGSPFIQRRLPACRRRRLMLQVLPGIHFAESVLAGRVLLPTPYELIGRLVAGYHWITTFASPPTCVQPPAPELWGR